MRYETSLLVVSLPVNPGRSPTIPGAAVGRGVHELTLDVDIPVVMAVGENHFADWIKFAGGMSVKIRFKSER
jgi:hypothetical protein